ncbi:MAG: YbhB/YbcL family Raf kinase inhibitor-like protein [Candidatus Jorgensenbacteria bacterium]|nr:YbhB/YbcL family Raf kinase inhibitor-like protein [Candidatus Jorgensenbacteria bacterium]
MADIVFTLKSTAFKDGGMIPKKFTCDGDDVSPFLEIKNAPEGTISFALIVDDPDATKGIPFDHWLLWNVPGNTQYISEDNIPHGAVQGMTSFERTKWGGPCPPSGSAPHRYVFTLYALSVILPLSAGGTKEELLKLMEGHVLGKAVLIGRYGRK